MLVGGSKPRALSTEPHSFLALPSSVKYLDPHKLEVMGAEAKAVLSAHLSLNWNHCPGHSLPREKAEGITLPNRKHSNITQTAQQPWSYILTQTPAGHNTEEGSIQEAKMIGETDRDRTWKPARVGPMPPLFTGTGDATGGSPSSQTDPCITPTAMQVALGHRKEATIRHNLPASTLS